MMLLHNDVKRVVGDAYLIPAPDLSPRDPILNYGDGSDNKIRNVNNNYRRKQALYLGRKDDGDINHEIEYYYGTLYTNEVVNAKLRDVLIRANNNYKMYLFQQSPNTTQDKLTANYDQIMGDYFDTATNKIKDLVRVFVEDAEANNITINYKFIRRHVLLITSYINILWYGLKDNMLVFLTNTTSMVQSTEGEMELDMYLLNRSYIVNSANRLPADHVFYKGEYGLHGATYFQELFRENTRYTQILKCVGNARPRPVPIHKYDDANTWNINVNTNRCLLAYKFKNLVEGRPTRRFAFQSGEQHLRCCVVAALKSGDNIFYDAYTIDGYTKPNLRVTRIDLKLGKEVKRLDNDSIEGIGNHDVFTPECDWNKIHLVKLIDIDPNKIKTLDTEESAKISSSCGLLSYEYCSRYLSGDLYDEKYEGLKISRKVWLSYLVGNFAKNKKLMMREMLYEKGTDMDHIADDGTAHYSKVVEAARGADTQLYHFRNW